MSSNSVTLEDSEINEMALIKPRPNMPAPNSANSLVRNIKTMDPSHSTFLQYYG